MIENSKNPTNNCKFCGWEFHQDIVQRIINNTQPVVCEFCGIELNISNVEIKTDFDRTKNEKTDGRDKGISHKKKATAKNFKKWISPQKYARNVINRDDEFPLIFKDNLIIVLSRLIYVAIRKWEEENNISIRRVSLEKAIQIYIIQIIKPILDKRVPSTFLNNLFKLKKEDFEEWLRLLQKKMALDQEYRTHFKFYLNWLIKIVFKLVSDMWDMRNLPRFYVTILKDLKDYDFHSIDYTDRSPENLLSIELKKECSKCHEIKPINEFSRRKDLKTNGIHTRSICKKCRAIDFAIKSYQVKLKIVTNIYQGKYEGKCSKCQADIKSLPVLEFHHLSPNLKNLTWKNITKKNWKETMRLLEKEEVEILCRNCHTSEGSKVFKVNEQIILKRDLFDFPALIIDKMVFKYVSENQQQYKKKMKFLILEWIKKRKIIEDLYNGTCVGCKQVNVYNNLPALEFHHLKLPDKDEKIRWRNIRKYDLKSIAKMLISEGCVCLCANCHKLIHSHQFVDNLQHIFNSTMIMKIKKNIEKIEYNIKNFNVGKARNISKFDKIFGYGENWKKFLLYIHALSVGRNNNLVEKEELTNFIGITLSNVNKNLRKLEDTNMIELIAKKKSTSIKLKPKAYKILNKILPILEKYKFIENKIPDKLMDKEIKDLIKLSKHFDDVLGEI